jgi:hypothetical protein
MKMWIIKTDKKKQQMVSLACALNSVTLVKDILEKVPHIDLAQSVGLLY